MTEVNPSRTYPYKMETKQQTHIKVNAHLSRCEIQGNIYPAKEDHNRFMTIDIGEDLSLFFEDVKDINRLIAVLDSLSHGEEITSLASYSEEKSPSKLKNGVFEK